MRKWHDRGGRRRRKKGPSDVEATGRVGQPKPSDSSRPAPLQPSYMDHFEKPAAAAGAPAAAGPPEVEVETQPESPYTPPTQPAGAIGRPPEKHEIGRASCRERV